MKSLKFKNGSPSKVRKIVCSTLIVWGLFAVFCLTIGAMLYSTDDPTAKVGLFSCCALVLAGGIGGIINACIYRGDDAVIPLFSSVISGALYFLISLVIAMGVKIGAVINLACFIFSSLLFITLIRRLFFAFNYIFF